MRKTILHISNTDIRVDSRILKELSTLGNLRGYRLLAIGVREPKGSYFEYKQFTAEIVGLNLFTDVFDWMPRPLRYLIRLITLTLILTLRGIKSNPAVVHCHDTFVLPAGLAVKLATRCKLVYDAHELESNKNGQSRVLSIATLVIEKLCWRWVDLLVSVSDSILDWYRNYFGPKESILVLNSPLADARTSARSEIRESVRYFHRLYDIPNDKLVFLYLGILGPGRGIEIALEAFASSSLDAHLVLVGYGDLSSNIQFYCDRHHNIHLHDPVPHDQVVSLAASADVGLCMVENVSLSDYYCLPNKLFEYCFAGLPILASDFPEIKKVIDEYALGTCCAPDPDRVRDAIQCLINHRPTRRQIDFSALSWDAQAERLLRAYRGLLASSSDVKPTQNGSLSK